MHESYQVLGAIIIIVLGTLVSHDTLCKFYDAIIFYNVKHFKVYFLDVVHYYLPPGHNSSTN